MNYFSQDFIVFVAIFFITVRSHLLEPPTGFFFIVRCEDDFDLKPEACHKQEEEEEEAKPFLLPSQILTLKGQIILQGINELEVFSTSNEINLLSFFCFRTRQSL